MRVFGLLIIVLLGLILVAWVVADVVGDRQYEQLGEEQWPAGLGTLASVEGRFPPVQTNDSAKRLIAFAAPLGISFAQPSSGKPDPMNGLIGDYVKAEHERADGTIALPSPSIVAHLAAHSAEIDALRDHLLRGETIEWDLDVSKGHDAPMPNLLAHMKIVRVLTARALVKARENDVGAWDDLHAAWRLSRSLEARPELISRLIVLSMDRTVNAAAWKLPPANAPWLEELQKSDPRRLLLAAHQNEAWSMWRHGIPGGVSGVIGRPYIRWVAVDMVRRQRVMAEEIAAMTTCGVDGNAFSQRHFEDIPRWNFIARIAMPSIGNAWQRAFRAVAEREATANAMRIGQGQPIVTTSVCSDGAWSFNNGRLAFSRELPKASPSETQMPLSLVIPARATRQST
ncbi:MAG TPA: hypothetical protein VGQ76_14505 [Thermoanaerobaculia bacterium]|nr:hypothetical protein [Thermoanaerobaculia bacterium]